MKVAWKELTYQAKKYILIEFLIVLMIFMVVFLTGLTNGLGRAVSAQIENYGQVHYLLSQDAEDIISFSHFSDQSLQEIQDLPENQLVGLAIQRAGLKKTAKSETIDVTCFVVEDSALVNPKVVSGHSLLTDSGQIVLDQSFKSHGIKLGDKILDSNSKKSLTVVGFAKDAMYGHSAIGLMRPSTYPKDTATYHNEIDQLSQNVNQMAQDLKNLAQLRQDFISNISHELKTPVASLVGLTDLLSDSDLDGKEQAELLELMQSETLRLSRLCDDILNLSWLDRQTRLRLEKVRIDE